MNHWILYIAILMLLAGCGGDQVRRPSAAVSGVTIAEILPTVTETPMPVLSFMMTTFLVDAEHFESVQACFYDLSQDTVRFRDKEAFASNGFFAAMGVGMLLGPMDGCLGRRGIQRIGQASLMMNPGFDLSFGDVHIHETQSVDYYTVEGEKNTTSFRSGTLSWTLLAEPDPDYPRRIRATIEPVYTPWAAQSWAGSDVLARHMVRHFETGRFDVPLRVSDFIVLGPRHSSLDKFTAFERLFFGSPGESNTIRFYVILCLGTEI